MTDADLVDRLAGIPHPFAFDPFRCVMAAVQELYPGLEADIQWVDDLYETDDDPYGRTMLPDDGGIPGIDIDIRTPVYGAVEVLAHELAHVATPDDLEHGTKWQAAFAAINKRYHEILEHERCKTTT